MVARPRRYIGILLFDQVEELDAVGPWEVLSYWTRGFPDDGFDVCCFSRDGGEVTCAKGLTVKAHRSFADVPPLDLLIHPGGLGARALAEDEEHLEWLRSQRAMTPVMASVCTGALAFAAAGLLRGRPATTHWRSLQRLAEIDPSVVVKAAERFVDDGDIITSAGISASIDMALHIVGRYAGGERSSYVRKSIQYDVQE